MMLQAAQLGKLLRLACLQMSHRKSLLNSCAFGQSITEDKQHIDRKVALDMCQLCRQELIIIKLIETPGSV